MAARKPKSADGVEKPNPFKSPTSNGVPKPRPVPMMPTAPNETALRVELTMTQKRLSDVEQQLRDEQAGRRADIERLLREHGDLRATIARLEAEAKAKGE